MPSTPLSVDFVRDLLTKKQSPTIAPKAQVAPLPRPPQYGPFRFTDEDKSCVSPKCGTSTRYRVQRVPLCFPHALIRLNTMLIERGVNE